MMTWTPGSAFALSTQPASSTGTSSSMAFMTSGRLSVIRPILPSFS
jgi:hypothetical protein